MFIFTLEPFVSSSAAEEQIATTFILAKDEAFQDVVHSEKISAPDNIYKFVYEPILEPDKNYYIKARRHFTEDNLDHDTPGKIIRFDKSRAEALIFNRNNIIETPWVEVNEEEFFNSDKTYFTITTSSFKSSMSTHEYTHWIVTDGNDEVLFVSLQDKTNKTSIRIDKNPLILSKTQLKVNVIHASTVGVESEVATVTLDLQKFNFEVISATTDLPVGTTYDLTLRRLNRQQEMNISKIEVVKPDAMAILYTIENTKEAESLTFSIPWYLFRSNTVVKLIITALDIKGDVGHNIIYLRTSNRGIREVEDLNFEYQHKLELIERSTTSNYAEGVTSMQIPEGYIPMPVVNSSEMFKFTINESNQLVNTGVPLTGVQLLSTNNSFTYVKYTENNLLVIDGWRDMTGLEKKPVFLVYRHNIHTDSYTLLAMIEHPKGDKNTCGKNGSLTQLTADTFLYMPVGDNKLYTIDIVKGSCEETDVLPSALATKDAYKWFLRAPMQRVIIQTANETFTYKYEIMRKVFEKSISVHPVSFVENQPVARLLPNGDNFIYKTKNVTTDNDGSCTVYSQKQNKFIQLAYKFEPTEYPNGSILLLNNNLILTKKTTVAESDTYITYMYY